MRTLCLAPLALLSAAALANEDFNGSKPMICAPLQGHDCVPTATACEPLKPEPGKDLSLYFDVAKMAVRTPYRHDTLPIESVGSNSKSLVMQGTNLEYVWSATIHRTTGRLTIVIADREGAYIVFGQCKVAGGKP
jgi:hypothetical protein